jgi:hypothetical protein
MTSTKLSWGDASWTSKVCALSSQSANMHLCYTSCGNTCTQRWMKWESHSEMHIEVGSRVRSLGGFTFLNDDITPSWGVGDWLRKRIFLNMIITRGCGRAVQYKYTVVDQRIEPHGITFRFLYPGISFLSAKCFRTCCDAFVGHASHCT